MGTKKIKIKCTGTRSLPKRYVFVTFAQNLFLKVPSHSFLIYIAEKMGNLKNHFIRIEIHFVILER